MLRLSSRTKTDIPTTSQLRARRQIQEVNLPRISGGECPNMEKVASIQGERSKSVPPSSVHSRLTERGAHCGKKEAALIAA